MKHFTFCPPFSLSLSTFEKFLFSQAPAAASSPRRRRKETRERTEAQGAGRNALRRRAVDPFAASSGPFRGCMCQQSRREERCTNCISACCSFSHLKPRADPLCSLLSELHDPITAAQPPMKISERKRHVSGISALRKQAS